MPAKKRLGRNAASSDGIARAFDNWATPMKVGPIHKGDILGAPAGGALPRPKDTIGLLPSSRPSGRGIKQD